MRALFDMKRFRLYAILGLVMLAMCTFHETHNGENLGRALLNNLWLASYITLVNYIFFEYAVPRLRWRRFFSSALRILLQFFLYTGGIQLWAMIGHALYLNTDYMDKAVPLDQRMSEGAAYCFSTFVLFGIVRHIYLHVKLRQTAQQLRIEKQEAELNYLKSQTNPHFLFNTLNNIYSLARDKSDLAPETILRLSKILRYMLYEAGGSYIAIEQELKIIGDYISLEKLRYDDTLRINFNYDVEDMHQALPPLLLMPLVENAFKHGVSETRYRPFVDIHLSVASRQLAFTVRNSTEEYSGDGCVKENIGLSNLRRQLELLYKDYTVSLEQKPAEFSALLKINLASHV